MKLRRLDLTAVGPFTDVQLDFSAGNCGVHVVFGPNEAGKSSSLRALHALLYGFHPRTPDDFRHQYKDLRVGGLFEMPDGKTLHCIRRKRNKDSLCDGDSDTPIDEIRLRNLLAGVEEDQFRQRFGLDHDQLRAGCQSLRDGKGDLAEALFSAGAGLGDVHKVVEAVRAEAAEIYKPSGKVQLLPKALADLHAADEVVKGCLESAPHWKQREEHLADLRSQLEALDDEIATTSARCERLGRFKIALPSISQRVRLQQIVSQLQQVPLVGSDFAGRRVSAMTQVEEACRNQEALEQTIAQTENELADMGEEAAELRREAEITQLYQSSGGYRDGLQDRPGLVTLREQLDKQSRHLLRELGHGELPFEKAAALHIDKMTREHIQKLASEQTLLETQRKQREEQAAELAETLQHLATEAAAAEPAATDDLAELIAEIRSAGDLERQWFDGLAANKTVEQELTRRLKRLTPWQGTLAELAETAVPGEETIRRYEQQLAASAEQQRSAAEKLQQIDDALASLEEEIAALDREHSVPTEDDLTTSRQAREASWQEIRGRWLDEGPSLDAHPDADDDADLADEFEVQTSAADLLADRLRFEAEQVAEKANKLAQREKLLIQQSRHAQQHAAADEAHSEVLAAWRQAWQATSVEPLSPREMLAWSTERDAILSAADALLREQSLAAQTAERLAAFQQRLAEAIEPLDSSFSASATTLNAALRQADALVKRLSDQRLAHEQALRDRAKAEADYRKHQQKLAELAGAAAQANEAWRKALTQFDIPPAATAAEAISLLATLDEYFRLRQESDELTTRIAGIDARLEAFAAASAELARAIEPALAQVPPARIAEELQQRLKTAHQQAARKTNLEQQLAAERKRLTELAEQIRKHESALDVLCQEAGCESVDQLPAVEEQSQQRREAQKELDQIEVHLAGLTQGQSLEAFITDVQSEQADQIPAEIERLETGKRTLHDQRDGLRTQITTLEREIQKATGGDRAARAAEAVKSELANIAVLAEDFARLKLAESVLAEAMKRYRQQNQGPILQRASEYFSLLTLGSFCGLKADWNEDGQAVLAGVRSDGHTTTRIDGMSSGSMDQLYLALRLASLEHHLKHREPLPLVVDDILIHFDDARSTAALKALAEVSRHTQVIMFTHHRHLVDLAQRALDPQTLFVQELPSPTE